MAYSTPPEVRLALIPTGDGSQPTEVTHTAADLSDAQIGDAISEADALIDGYIGGYYAVPVASVPNSNPATYPSPLTYWSRTIAAYLATCTYRGSQDFADTDPVARRYRDVIAALKDVSSGRLKLQVAQNETGNSASAVGNIVNPYIGDLFTPDDFSLTPGVSPTLNGNRGNNGWYR